MSKTVKEPAFLMKAEFVTKISSKKIINIFLIEYCMNDVPHYYRQNVNKIMQCCAQWSMFDSFVNNWVTILNPIGNHLNFEAWIQHGNNGAGGVATPTGMATGDWIELGSPTLWLRAWNSEDLPQRARTVQVSSMLVTPDVMALNYQLKLKLAPLQKTVLIYVY